MMPPDVHGFDLRCSFHTLPFWSGDHPRSAVVKVEIATAQGQRGEPEAILP
jgi:hypothetical protein